MKRPACYHDPAQVDLSAAQVQHQGQEMCRWNRGKPPFISVPESTAEASGDVRLGSKVGVQEWARNYFEDVFASKTVI